MREIPLTQGKVALIDDEDFLLVSQYKWCAHKPRHTFYAVTGVRKADGKKTVLKMHRLLMPDAKRVDHRDGDGLNNQHRNLRSASVSQNMANSRKRCDAVTSQFRGVCWDNVREKFRAQIRDKHLGRFASEVDAARAYDAAALQYFGEFARLNFPQQELPKAA